jgi:hypothetical protein
VGKKFELFVLRPILGYIWSKFRKSYTFPAVWIGVKEASSAQALGAYLRHQVLGFQDVVYQLFQVNAESWI